MLIGAGTVSRPCPANVPSNLCRQFLTSRTNPPPFLNNRFLQGIDIRSKDDFLAMGGDSLSALAVSKRLVEGGGGMWPQDGVVTGCLAACELVRLIPCMETW